MRLFSFLLILWIWPRHLNSAPPWNLVFWNVGQGSFTTYAGAQTCVHWDAGGERFPWKVIKLCKRKKNILHFTHFDKDHRNFVHRLFKHLPDLCVDQAPPPVQKKWRQHFPSLKVCTKSPSQKLYHSLFLKRNESHVYSWKQRLLITGDAHRAQEKQLIKNQRQALKSIQILLLGHHGSRTSTHKELLNALPRLQLAIASTRHKKYGHPHKEVLQRLKQKKVPWLSTEDFGHIHMWIPEN